MSKWFCPVPFKSLSLEAGYQQRLCCHATSDEEWPAIHPTSIHVNVQSKPLKKIRTQLLNGEVPGSCHSCWALEHSGATSPRQEYLTKLNELPPAADANYFSLKYLDITQDSNCNLKCRSCSGKYSTPIRIEEIGREVRSPEDIWPDKFAYSDWLDKAIEMLDPVEHYITVTGGEPLISKNTQILIEKLKTKNKIQKTHLRVFSNLTQIPTWFINEISSFKTLEVIASIDAVDNLSSYVRYPSVWGKIEKNLDFLVEQKIHHPQFEIRIHSVLQAYNLFHLPQLIRKLKKYQNVIPYFPKFTELVSPKVLKPTVWPEIKKNKAVQNALLFLEEEINDLTKNKWYDENTVAAKNLAAILQNLYKRNDENLFFDFLVYTRLLDGHRGQNLNSFIPEILD